ncbi:MAG TPA: glycosyltransferase, partial [Candidatus Methylacidiphilales bacterium]
NRAEFLLDALESARGQTRLPDEIFVSDDMGSDEVRKLVFEFGNSISVPVSYSHCTSGQNQVENVNHCFRSARSDLILLLHDDDLLMPRAGECLRQPFLEDDSLVATYGKQVTMTDGGEDLSSDTFNQKYHRTPAHAGVQPDAFVAGIRQQFPNDGYMVRASVAQKVLLRHSAGGAADFDFGLRLSETGRFFFLDEFTAKYRFSAESVGRGAGARTDDSALVAVRISRGLLKSHPQYAGEINNAIRRLSPTALRMALKQGALGEAIGLYFGPHYPRGF